MLRTLSTSFFIRSRVRRTNRPISYMHRWMYRRINSPVPDVIRWYESPWSATAKPRQPSEKWGAARWRARAALALISIALRVLYCVNKNYAAARRGSRAGMRAGLLCRPKPATWTSPVKSNPFFLCSGYRRASGTSSASRPLWLLRLLRRRRVVHYLEVRDVDHHGGVGVVPFDRQPSRR